MIKLINQQQAEIILPNQTIWVDKQNYQNVANSYIETLGGIPHVYSMNFTHQRLITLEFKIEAIGNTLTYDTVALLKTEANKAGNMLSFKWFNEAAINVMFHHSDGRYSDSQAVQLTAYLNLLPPNESKDFFTGKISLITV
jgi:hypothetical protein